MSKRQYFVWFTNLLNVSVCHPKKGELKVGKDPKGFGEEVTFDELVYSWCGLEEWGSMNQKSIPS